MEPIEVCLLTERNGRRQPFGWALVGGEQLPQVVIFGPRAFVRTIGTDYVEESAARVQIVTRFPSNSAESMGTDGDGRPAAEDRR